MTLPFVTVAVPVLNEAAHIDACLTALCSQSYLGPMEILVLDGGSSDETAQRAACYPEVTVLDNPGRTQAAALNLALGRAQGEVVVRVDGHCLVAPDYVDRCVDALISTGAAMVGGGMAPAGGEGFSGAVAAAMRTRLGIGTARFHRPDAPAGWVDTVYLGAFRAQTGRQVGGYDEAMVVNEDAEFAWRLRAHGGIWFDPTIRSTYQPRSGSVALARQFYRYGMGRVATAVRHPGSLSLRQLAAPGLILGLASPWRVPVVVGYGLALLTTVGMARRMPVRQALRVPLAVATMHLAWGLGFFVGLPRALATSIRTGHHG